MQPYIELQKTNDTLLSGPLILPSNSIRKSLCRMSDTEEIYPTKVTEYKKKILKCCIIYHLLWDFQLSYLYLNACKFHSFTIDFQDNTLNIVTKTDNI